MKKVISLILAFTLCFVLAACGSNNSDEVTVNEEIPPIEEITEATVPTLEVDVLLENAQVITPHKFFEEANGNIVRVESEYTGKPVLFKDQIIDIQKDYIVVGAANTRVTVYLPTEDIMAVNKNQYVLVAGNVSNISLGQEASLPFVAMDMEQGYLALNQDTDFEPLYKNAEKLVAEGNYADAILLLYQLDSYSPSVDLLMEAACKAAFEGTESKDVWQDLAVTINPAPLSGEDIAQIIIGDWRTRDGNNYSVFEEDGAYRYFMAGEEANPDIPNTWYIDGDQLHIESEYTSNTYTIYPFYKNAYVFCIHQSSSNALELRFHNGPLE